MLKFIRKFQLVILAVGGSLLMVVFLLEPVLTSFQRSQMNRTVARYGDGSKITSFDLDRARSQLELAKRVAPVVFLPKQQGGLGLLGESERGEQHVYHWLLLERMADEAGLIGGVEDGRELIEVELETELVEISQRLRMALMQGAITPEEATEQLGQYESLRRQQINREVLQAATYARGATEDDIWRSLAGFMGAYRLVQMYLTAPAFSPAGARAGMRDLNDAVAVNAALIPGTVMAEFVPEPTEEELQAFFEERAGVAPSEDPFGIGYVQPARIRLGWLALDREQMAQAVAVDRVELRKMWEADSRRPEGERMYPGDFASERSRIEAAYRENKTDQLMVEADRIVRAEVLRATRGLDRDGDMLVLPEDWETVRPRLDAIAETVVTRMGEQGVSLPTPTVQIPENTWLGADRIASTPGVGRSFFRVGSRTVLAQEIPGLMNEQGVLPGIGLQVGVPQADPAASDTMGNRYYLLVLGHRPAGPAESIDDAGRERVIADYKAVRGFRLLEERLDEFRALAAGEGGVPAVVSMALEGADLSRVVRPGVLTNVRVSPLRVAPSAQSRFVDPQLDQEAFRDAVLDAARGLDPLTPPATVAEDPRGVAVALPSARAIAVARVVAPRPFTAEEFNSSFQQAINLLSGRALREGIDANEQGDPFGYEALRARYGVEVTATDDEA